MHGNRRYIFMDLDAITQMIVTSRKLFTKVPGAKSAWDIRINFKALTRLVCKNDGAKVQRQVATYGKTNSLLVSQLERYGWKMVKQAVTTVAMAQLEMLEELALSTSSAPSKTLVLLVGNRGQSVPDREKWTRILVTFLEQNWRIEMHSWRESFNTKFLRAFKAYPGQITMTKLDDAVGELLYLSQKKRMGKNTDKTTASTSAITLQREISTSTSTGLAIYEKEEVSRHLQAAKAESATKIQLQEETFEWDLQQDRNEPYHDKYERNNCSQLDRY